MKIIKVKNKTVGDTIYWKHLIAISEKIVKASGLWGKKLKTKAEKGRIIIEKE